MKLSRLLKVAAAGHATLLAHATAAHAAEGDRTPLKLDAVEPTRAAAGGGGGLLRTFIGLVVVVAAIYGVYWILKQVKASREEKASGSGLSSLASLPLGAGRSLHMVRAGSEVVLIGVAEHGVTPIKTYGEGEARAAGILDSIDDPAGWDLVDEGPAPANGAASAPAANGTGNGSGGAPVARQALDSLRRRTVRR